MNSARDVFRLVEMLRPLKGEALAEALMIILRSGGPKVLEIVLVAGALRPGQTRAMRRALQRRVAAA